MRTTRDERLDYAERWLRDGLRTLHPDVSVMQVQVDMTRAMECLDRARRAGVMASATHLVVQAAARALRQNPDLHQLVAGNTRHWPSRVDIGLSITGEAFVAPVLVIEGADGKSLAELVDEIARRTPEAQRADQQMRTALRNWGWLVPVAAARRAILRALFTRPAFRRKGAGTFQISTVPVDWAFTTSFATAGVLIAGQVRSHVVAVDGQPAVRPMMTLTLSGDHGVWDGRRATRFLATVKSWLEKPTLNESGAIPDGNRA